jgi:hypothetical protein
MLHAIKGSCRQDQEQGFHFIPKAHILIMFEQGADAEDIADDCKEEQGKVVYAAGFYDAPYPPCKYDEVENELWDCREGEGDPSGLFAFGKMGEVEGIQEVVVFDLADLRFHHGVTGGRREENDA